MGHSHFRHRDRLCQDPDPFLVGGPQRPHPHCRRCLLKGCEHWFFPRRSQQRYCGPTCQHEARRWRRWHAAQRYRASEAGKQRRRAQNRRYRERQRQQATPASDPVTTPIESPTVPETVPIHSDGREGQRPEEIPEKSSGHPCHRPGCYECFLPAPRSPGQRFCSGLCRLALRRVRQRERRLRQRRRQGKPARRTRSRPDP